MNESSNLPMLRQNIFLIGDVDTQIYGNKLPSKLQALKVLFFNLRSLHLSLRESTILVAKEVAIFWDKARLPTKTLYRSADVVEVLYEKWRKLQRNAGKASNTPKEEEFTSELQNLLDVSSGDILEHISEEQKEFLFNQRKPGRVGYIANFQSHHDIQERAQAEKEMILKRRLQKSEEEKDRLSKYPRKTPINASKCGQNFKKGNAMSKH